MSLPNIGLCGYMRSGKDTIADYLIEKHGYTRFGFAQALKEEVARGIGCAAAELDVEPLRSQVRPVLQVWGTEFRRAQDSNYWVAQAEVMIIAHERVRPAGPIVFNDVRFHNEIDMLRGRGFTIIKLDMSIEDVLVEYPDAREVALARLQHASEREWQEAEFDVVIPSVRGNLQGLYDSIGCVVVGEGMRGYFNP